MYKGDKYASLIAETWSGGCEGTDKNGAKKVLLPGYSIGAVKILSNRITVTDNTDLTNYVLVK